MGRLMCAVVLRCVADAVGLMHGKGENVTLMNGKGAIKRVGNGAVTVVGK